MKSLTLILTVASLLIFITMPVKAGMIIDNPYSGVNWTGGSTQKIVWQDDNKSPSFSDMKTCTFTLMAGTQDTQFPATVLATGVDPSSLSTTCTVPKNVGPPGDFYFLRIDCTGCYFYSGYFSIVDVDGNIANFNPNNPGVPLTSTTAGSSATPSVSTKLNKSAQNSSSANATQSATSSDTATPSDSAPSPTSNGNKAANTQAPTAKSSDSDKLVTNFYVSSLILSVMAFYLF